MKSYLFILFFIFTSIQSFSQSRVNREKLSFADSSDLFINATGWGYNAGIGEWIDYENVISRDIRYKEDYPTLQGPYMMSKTDQQFLDIQTKSLDYEGSRYYVLLIRKMDGNYKYPTIKRDWYYWEETHGYIFSQEEYQKLYNISDTIFLETDMLEEMGTSFREYDENIFIHMIQNELKSDYHGFYTYTFPILKTMSDSSEVIRFYTPSKNLERLDFKTTYFETTPAEFNKLILYDNKNE